MKKSLLCLASLLACFTITSAKADVIADWTFQSALSTNNIIGAGLTPSGTQSGVLADIGTGTASASHATAGSVWSIPAGNGSTNSWSVNNWSVGDYFQFQVSTLTFRNINVSFDQTSSGTGPRDFGLFYSLNGTTFTQFGANYSVLPNAAPNPLWNSATASSLYSFAFDLSAITALNNSSADYFRLVDMSTTSAGGGTVGTAGADRVDNFMVSTVPEPTTLALTGMGLMALVALRRKI
jgi:hypothetical protein